MLEKTYTNLILLIVKSVFLHADTFILHITHLLYYVIVGQLDSSLTAHSVQVLQT